MKLPKSYHLMVIAGLTVLGMLFSMASPGLLRTLFTLPMVFVLPGYAVMAAFFPRRLASFPGNILFVTTWSLAITSLGTLLLHKAEIGLQTQTWALWLGGVTLVNVALAMWQHETVFDRDKPYRLPAYQLVLITGALVLGGVALHTARQGAAQPGDNPFTQLWMLPTKVTNAIEVGALNNEGQVVSYRLIVAGESFQIEKEFTLNSGEQWETTLKFPIGVTQKIEAQLYRLDMPDSVYRTTLLWLSDIGTP